MKIAIIGLGEVGCCYAKPLHRAGYELYLCAPRPTQAALDLAMELGLPIYPHIDAWISEANWIILCVTGAHVLEVVEECLRYAKTSTSICDMTTASPNVKKQAANMSTTKSVRYIDTAIMGAISLNLIKTPLLSSGDGAKEYATLMEKIGAPVQVITGGAPGDAISLKILRSVFTKGMEALSVELLMAAEKQGVRQKLYEQLQDINDTPLETFIDMLVKTHVLHAKRRVHEVQAASDELAKHGLPSVVLPGVKQRFLLTKAPLENNLLPPANPTIEQALQWLLQTNAPSLKTVMLIDWDGCLCDSMGQILKRIKIVGEELKIKFPEKYNISDEKLQTRWTREFNSHLQYVFGELWEEARHLYNKYIYHEELPPKKAFAGATEFIESIQRAQLPFAIVSNTSTASVKEGIKILGWEKLLAETPIIASDQIKPNVKPDPFHFLQALKQLGVDINNRKEFKIIVVGDGADSDMLGALQLAEQDFKVTAIWINHAQSIACNLKSANNFLEVKDLVLQTI